ncbi:MAG: hypothetical protein WDO56_02925 [Gammaproteobacteria bacterium]
MACCPAEPPSPPDQVVVNSATQRLISAIGLPRISAPGVNPVSRGYVNFLFGDHGSIIDPTSSAATTREMQVESISFVNSSGAAVAVGAGAPGVVQP